MSVDNPTFDEQEALSHQQNAISEAPEYEALQQAADWFATLNDESATDQDKAQWVNWLNQHSQHQLAWQYVEKVGQRFQQVQYPGSKSGTQGAVDSAINSALKAARTTRRKAIQSSGALCVLAWLSWRFTPLQTYTSSQLADHSTATGETQEVALNDGGQIWLNTASAINIKYQTSLCEIILVTGEILIQTAPDQQQRPFIVNSSEGSMRALGTRFTVRQQDEFTLLSVYEGAVEIITLNGNAQIIEAGYQTRFSRDAIQAPVEAERAREAWSRGLIVADNISLGELITEVGRYRQGHINVDPSIANLRVMGTYPVNQPERVLTMLEDALPVKVRKIMPWWITLEQEE